MAYDSVAKTRFSEHSDINLFCRSHVGPPQMAALSGLLRSKCAPKCNRLRKTDRNNSLSDSRFRPKQIDFERVKV